MLTLLKTLSLSLTVIASFLFPQSSAAPTPVFKSFAGNVSLDAVKALPPTHTTSISVRGYPGSNLHVGAFTSLAEWNAFAKTFKAKQVVDVDWKTQAIAFVVFDGQTNALSDLKLSVKNSVGSLTFDWDGIEPFYVDSTPAVLRVIDRRGLKKLTFKHAAMVGSVSF